MTNEEKSSSGTLYGWRWWGKFQWQKPSVQKCKSAKVQKCKRIKSAEQCRPELSTGRMDPRVGSGHDFAGFWRVGLGQHFGFFIAFYWLFLGTWIDMNLRILLSDWLTFYDIQYIMIN